MRCVNDTLPPRDRARWLLITMRLSASSLAGTARTLVAVGTVSETFMFFTTAAAAPRSGDWEPAATGVAGFAAGFAASAGLGSDGLLAAGLLSAGFASAGLVAGAGAGAAALGAGCGAGAGCAGAGAAFWAVPLPDAVGCSRSPPPTGLPGR